ncbi:restriction endonuclease subunit S [Enterobacter hormaechei subsp. hoffmannii]|jgi:type I restriction enzyme S subunit|uniref:restriction endonuclease subunit S n=1 Tax=Enterobacteriaceae TaxID=543 RepID=UPI001D0D3603|nr:MULTISPECIES: restriction endonuclease subunit S [Enterobacteriaceae]MCW4713675.1 restriction endonuclease subunit S [Enterobacter hormaechei subsp. hoffmannii]
MMFATFIKPNDLAQRIDPEHHSPELLEMKRLVQSRFPTSTFRKECSRMNSGPFGSALLSSAYVSKHQGVLFVRPQDCKNLIVDDDNDNVYISFEDNNRLKSSKFKTGSIIITKIGNGIGEMAVLPNNIDECNISGNAMGAVLKGHDSYFAVSFLRGKYGQAEVKRGLSGGAKPKIDMESIGSIVFPLVNEVAQKYIGNKVRQAEKLRVWAKRLYRTPAFIDAFIQGALPLSLTDSLFSLIKSSNNDAIKELTKFLALNIEDAQMKQNFQDFIEKNKMGSVDIEREFFHINTVSTLAIEDFLSAQTYRPAITDAFDKITSKKFSTLQSISLEPIRQGATPKFSAIGKKCIKSKQTRDLFLDETGYEIVDPDDEQNKRIVRLKRNDILVTRQGAGTVGRASIFLDDEETYITDSLFLVRIDPVKANPAFVAGFLRSYTGQRLIEKGVYGSTGQLNLSSTALRNIPILDVPLEFQNFLGETLCTADTLFKLSTRLTQSAKTLVEALIEGQLTEQQLIQAQQSLEDGDNSLDQAILSKLSAEGYAIEGATPLFSDVDELYSLLGEAAQAEAEE